MIIIQHEYDIAQCGEVIQQGRQQHIEWAAAATIEAPPSVASPICGAIVCKAATRYTRKRAGALSPSSSDNQATLTPPGRGMG